MNDYSNLAIDISLVLLQPFQELDIIRYKNYIQNKLDTFLAQDESRVTMCKLYAEKGDVYKLIKYLYDHGFAEITFDAAPESYREFKLAILMFMHKYETTAIDTLKALPPSTIRNVDDGEDLAQIVLCHVDDIVDDGKLNVSTIR